MTQTSFANGQLKAIVERIERLEEEKKTIAADIKEIYSEAKGNGYDVKALRKIIAERKRDAAELAQENAMVDFYKDALGMIVESDEGNGGIADEVDTSKPVQGAVKPIDTANLCEAVANKAVTDYDAGLVSSEYADGVVAGCIYINDRFGGDTALSVEPWTPLSKAEMPRIGAGEVAFGEPETGEIVQVAA